jgi:hypothetical protein
LLSPEHRGLYPGAEPSVDQSRCGLEGQELPRRGLYVSFARRNRPRELPDGRSPHQSGDPPYDSKERGDRRVRPVASDSERARLAEVDDKSVDEVNPDQHAPDRHEQVRPRHHQPAGHHPP